MTVRDRILYQLRLDQAWLLSERYVMLLLGELPYLLLLMAQAPFIAGMIVLAWGESTENPRLYLFLCLAAIWMGCANACREIVKERAVLRRERRVGVGLVPYLLSKLMVLGVLTLVQMALLVAIVHYRVGLTGSGPLLAAALWSGALTGTALGLLVSASVSSSDKAVGLVPLVILPQVLFTEPFLPAPNEGGLASLFENLTLLGWTMDLYEAVRSLSFDPQYVELVRCGGALAGLFSVMVGLTLVALNLEE